MLKLLSLQTAIGCIDLVRLSCITISFYLLELTWEGYFNGNSLITIEKQGTWANCQFHAKYRKFQNILRANLPIQQWKEKISDWRRGWLLWWKWSMFQDDEAEKESCCRQNFSSAEIPTSSTVIPWVNDFERLAMISLVLDSSMKRISCSIRRMWNCKLIAIWPGFPCPSKDKSSSNLRISLLPGESTPIPWLTQNMREGKSDILSISSKRDEEKQGIGRFRTFIRLSLRKRENSFIF